MITPKNLIRHELIGLQVRVEKSANKKQEGISGTIVDETKNMLIIKSGEKEKKIQKKGASFIFNIPSGKKVMVDGDLLVARPEDRIKSKVQKW